MNDKIAKETQGKLDLESGTKEANRLVQSALNGSSGTASQGLGSLAAHLAQSTGKGVRTKVLLTSAMDENAFVPVDAAKASAAIELLHMATLVHDDVIDDAETRRGQKTLHYKFGNRNAILCGDYLLSMSIAMLAGIEFGKNGLETPMYVRRIAKAMTEICQGEYSQHKHSGNVDLAVLTYLRVISGKTAALFYASAFLGGTVGGENNDAALALGSFGRQLGMMFQIADDCKDYEMDEAAAQKPVGKDLRNGVITLPLILALRRNPALRKQTQAVIKNEADVAMLVSQVRDTGGPEMARGVARRFEKRAERVLSAVDSRKREALLSIMRSVLPNQKT